MGTPEKWFVGALVAASVYFVVSLAIIVWNFEQGLAIRRYEIQIRNEQGATR